MTADKKQISVPFTASDPVKTVEINFSGPEPAQIAELFIHTKKSVPGKNFYKKMQKPFYQIEPEEDLVVSLFSIILPRSKGEIRVSRKTT